jgi:hypothetical protein
MCREKRSEIVFPTQFAHSNSRFAPNIPIRAMSEGSLGTI